MLSRFCFALCLAPPLVLVACGGTSTPGGSSDASHVDVRDAMKGTDALGDAHAHAHDSGHDAGTTPDTGSGSDGGLDAPVTDAPFDATGFVPIDAGGGAITGVTPETWTFIPFPESHCRDGSTTGLGVNFNPASQNLLIYLEGGGACFNATTCGVNPASFGATDFPTRFPTVGDSGVPQSGNGILDRTAANPVNDWNFVYVPYCTGDIHAGNNPAGVVDGLPTQQFVGYQNMDLFLQRIVPTFSAASHVLLTGISGGGFGAAANYIHTQRAFGSVPVDMLDDSGPFMEDPYLPACLQNQVRALWGIDATVGADCAGHCNDPEAFFLDFAKYAVTSHPTRHFGLLDSLGDGTITSFFGFGADDCTGFQEEPASMFAAGLGDIRTQVPEANLGTFYFTGTDHTSLADDSFYQRSTSSLDGGASVALTAWVGSLVAGSPYNAGPP